MSELKIELEHVLGIELLTSAGETIADVLAQYRLPETMFQPYILVGGLAEPIPTWTTLAAVQATTDKVIIRAIRNTLLATILPRPRHKPDIEGITYGTGFRSVHVGSDGMAIETTSVVTQQQARQLVMKQVSEFVETFGVSERGCVFGVSGGGDSNALAFGLRNSLGPDRLVAFTLVFADVMPKAAADRASVLCQELGIHHRVFDPDALKDYLRIATSVESLYADFTDLFGEEALHFFGTFLILRTARALAKECGFGDLAFGYNREDLLAEMLFMLMNGNAPLAYPTRPIGPHRIVMPVWKSPKLLLDACHTNFSLENYRERDDATTRQRSLAFYLAHSLDSAYPTFGLSVLTGAQKVFDGAFGELLHHQPTDLFITRQATPERVALVDELLRKHFST